MTTTATAPKGAPAPWHLWAVGAVSLLWNGYGAFDYFVTKTQGEAYLRSLEMTEAQIAHYNQMPAWMTAVWAIGVWGAALGSVLLLLRSRWAVEVFLASLIAYVVSLIYAYVISPVPDAPGWMVYMQAGILAACVFFVWYAHGQRKAGALR